MNDRKVGHLRVLGEGRLDRSGVDGLALTGDDLDDGNAEAPRDGPDAGTVGAIPRDEERTISWERGRENGLDAEGPAALHEDRLPATLLGHACDTEQSRADLAHGSDERCVPRA